MLPNIRPANPLLPLGVVGDPVDGPWAFVFFSATGDKHSPILLADGGVVSSSVSHVNSRRLLGEIILLTV